jgi:hypothetical protein
LSGDCHFDCSMNTREATSAQAEGPASTSNAVR